MFYCPRLVLDALSFPGVRESHCNDSLTEGKKMDMDKHKARKNLANSLWLAAYHRDGNRQVGAHSAKGSRVVDGLPKAWDTN